MALVKDKNGDTKQVSDFIAGNNQLLKKYGYMAVNPANGSFDLLPQTPKKKAANPAVHKNV